MEAMRFSKQLANNAHSDEAHSDEADRFGIQTLDAVAVFTGAC